MSGTASPSDAWLESEVSALVRDFGMFRVLGILAKLAEPNFADAGDEIIRAYSVCDANTGNHNVVNLADLRRAVTMDRKSFDQILYRLVVSHRLNLVPTNICYRLSDDEKQAQFKHGTERYLFVSKVLVQTATVIRPVQLHENGEKDKPLTRTEQVELALVGKPT